MGFLGDRTSKKSFGGNIGAVRQVSGEATSSKPWDDEVFAPDPILPAANSVDRPQSDKQKKDKRRKSSINQAEDRQLGVLENEDY